MFSMFTFVIALVIAQVLAGVIILGTSTEPKGDGMVYEEVHENDK